MTHDDHRHPHNPDTCLIQPVYARACACMCTYLHMHIHIYTVYTYIEPDTEK